MIFVDFIFIKGVGFLSCSPPKTNEIYITNTVNIHFLFPYYYDIYIYKSYEKKFCYQPNQNGIYCIDKGLYCKKGFFMIQSVQNGVDIEHYSTNFKNNNVYYAKKGEVIYDKKMDSDEDGIVTFDEFKDYCAQNNIAQDEINKMLKNWVTLRAAQKIEKNNEEINKENNNKLQIKETIYAKRGDLKYDDRMDLNSDEKVTYQEYIRYCKENLSIPDKKSNIEGYSNDKEAPEGMIDEEA